MATTRVYKSYNEFYFVNFRSWIAQKNLLVVILYLSEFCQSRDQGDEADDEEIYNVVQSLKRLTYMYVYNDLSPWKLYDQVELYFISMTLNNLFQPRVIFSGQLNFGHAPRKKRLHTRSGSYF